MQVPALRWLLVGMLLATGEPALGQDGEAAAGDVAAQAVAAAGTAAPALPDVDPDAYFKGQTGGTFGKNIVTVLPRNPRVAVGGFRVVFVIDSSITATVRASYMPGRDTTGAASKTQVALAGVEATAMQAITDQAYARFLEQLRLAGREVVGAEELQAFYGGLQPTPSSVDAPYRKEVSLGHGKQTALAFSPTGVPLWWTSWDAPWTDSSAFKQTNIRRLGDYSKELNAIMIAPMIVVDFAQMSGSGNRSGLIAREAETSAELGVSVAAMSSPVLRAEETRNGMLTKGDDGSVALTQPFASELAFATLTVSEKSENKGLVGAFAKLGLNAGSAKSRSANQATSDGERYSAAALDALGQATGTFARLFGKYPPN